MDCSPNAGGPLPPGQKAFNVSCSHEWTAGESAEVVMVHFHIHSLGTKLSWWIKHADGSIQTPTAQYRLGVSKTQHLAQPIKLKVHSPYLWRFTRYTILIVCIALTVHIVHSPYRWCPHCTYSTSRQRRRNMNSTSKKCSILHNPKNSSSAMSMLRVIATTCSSCLTGTIFTVSIYGIGPALLRTHLDD